MKKRVLRELKNRFGGVNAKDPLTGVPDHQISLAEGILFPVEVDEIVDILNKAPDGFEA